MAIRVEKDNMRQMVRVTFEYDERLLELMDRQVPQMIMEDVAKQFADHYFEQHSAEILAAIAPKKVTEMVLAEMSKRLSSIQL